MTREMSSNHRVAVREFLTTEQRHASGRARAYALGGEGLNNDPATVAARAAVYARLRASPAGAQARRIPNNYRIPEAWYEDAGTTRLDRRIAGSLRRLERLH